MCEDLALIHEAFLCLCRHVDKAGIKISDVNYEPDEDSSYKEIYQIELMETKCGDEKKREMPYYPKYYFMYGKID